MWSSRAAMVSVGTAIVERSTTRRLIVHADIYDRIAAVGHIVRQVPVAGRILFLDGAEFTKGVPSLVSTLDELLAEFGEPDKAAAKFKIEAFKPH